MSGGSMWRPTCRVVLLVVFATVHGKVPCAESGPVAQPRPVLPLHYIDGSNVFGPDGYIRVNENYEILMPVKEKCLFLGLCQPVGPKTTLPPEHGSMRADTSLVQTDRTDTNDRREESSQKQDGRVPWEYSLEAVQQASRKTRKAYAVYICSESAATVAGEGPTAWAAYKLAHSGSSPRPTIFDDPAVLSSFKAAGIQLFLKIVCAPENLAQRQVWNAGENTLIIIKPDGTKMASFAGQDCTQREVTTFLGTFIEKFSEWQKAENFKENLKPDNFPKYP